MGSRSRGDGEQGRLGVKMARISSHKELDVYKMAFESSMRLFDISKSFPKEERYALTDQIRRASRAVCSNVAEAWRKRRYEKSFILLLNNAEAEAAEVQTWLDFSLECGYLNQTTKDELHKSYDFIIGKLVNMIRNPSPWVLTSNQLKEDSG